MSESIENTYSDDVCNMDVCDNAVITPKSDFVEMMNGILGELNIKMSMFLFIIGMFLFSDMYYSRRMYNYKRNYYSIDAIYFMLFSIGFINER